MGVFCAKKVTRLVMERVTTEFIAEKLALDRSKVCYILRRAGIQPVAKEGAVCFYPPHTVGLVQALLQIKPLRQDKIRRIMSRFPAIVA